MASQQKTYRQVGRVIATLAPGDREVLQRIADRQGSSLSGTIRSLVRSAVLSETERARSEAS